MDFQLTEEQRMIQEMVRDFAENEIMPIAAKMDQEGEFPSETFKKMGELGILGLPWPEEYGGAGADTVCYAIATEEISRACGSHGLSYAAHISLGSSPIYLFGTEEQKKKYLTPLARGEAIGALGLTEPEAGSDAGSTKTTAVLDGKEWVINGAKSLITNGPVAEIAITVAKTDPSASGSHGISTFIVETDRPGFSVGKVEDKFGLRASPTSQLFYEDCRIPKENLLGKEGEGFRQILEVLDGGRISIGAMALGLGQAALEASIKYAKERHQFGRPIGDFQAVQWMIADAATRMDAARLLVYKAAYLEDQGKKFTKEAAMGKLFASEAAELACYNAIQIHAGYGYTKDYPVERYYRDNRLTQIGEGTSEIQRLVIARQILDVR
ncbi:MAG: acyl-CoA dehydrogenase [Anaerolineae bacterium]|nr:acyl-CoA dehydrogenase [Anaerolineae bacterium]NIN94051.1 acyl-CoA dehydrogenase [Anaerolineae bacterium]NIQ77092.1 acyl-CoA dehydrogenase [Anaerolineae bacterium]